MTTVLYPLRMYPDETAERRIFGEGVDIRVRNAASLAELSEDDCAATDGLMIFRQFVSAQDIARFPRLRAIVRMGVGYDRIDRAAAASRGILVCNVPDYGTTEVADHAIALALALRRGLLLHHEAQRHDKPAAWLPIEDPLVRRFDVQTFGVVGLGRIGTAAALRAKGLGFRVVFYDPYRPNGTELALGIARAGTLDDLLRQSDVLSLHTPLTRETRGMIGAKELALLPAGAVVVNTARGPILDLDALADGVRAGRVAGGTVARDHACVPGARGVAGGAHHHHAALRVFHARGGCRHPHQVGRDDARRIADQPAAERHRADRRGARRGPEGSATVRRRFLGRCVAHRAGSWARCARVARCPVVLARAARPAVRAARSLLFRHREPPLGGVAIQGRAAGVCHAALDCHGAPRLAITWEWLRPQPCRPESERCPPLDQRRQDGGMRAARFSALRRRVRAPVRGRARGRGCAGTCAAACACARGRAWPRRRGARR